MDPDIIAELNAQLKQMTDIIGQQNGLLSSQLKSIQDNIAATKNQTTATSNETQNINAATAATSRFAQASTEAEKKLSASMQNLSNAFSSGVTATKSFVSAMVSSEDGTKKYAGAVSAAGDAAFSIGKNFGILGTVVGGLFKGLGALAGVSLDMWDTMIQMNREGTRFAGVLPGTVRNVADLSAQAGYAGDKMMKLIKIAEGVGDNLVALGGTAGSGVIRFEKLANVGNKVYENFSKLGVSQEALTAMQADYVRMQGMSGQAYALQNKTMAQLQKESLDYATNLIKMSSITGQTADQMQKEREIVKSEFEERVKVRQEELQAQRLEADGRHEEAQRIRNESAARTAMLGKMSNAYGTEVASMMGRVLRTGTIDQFTAGLATMNIDFAGLRKSMKEANTEQERNTLALRLGDQYISGVNTNIDRVGDALQYGGEALGKQFGIVGEALGRSNNAIGKSLSEREAMADAELKAKQGQSDSAAQAQADLETKSREVQMKFQTAMLDLAEQTIVKVVIPSLEAMDFMMDLASKGLGAFRAVMDLAIKGLLFFAGATVLGAVVKTVTSVITVLRGFKDVIFWVGDKMKSIFGWIGSKLGFGGGPPAGPGGGAGGIGARIAGVPIIGGVIAGGLAGYNAYQASGSLGRAAFVGLGTGISSIGGSVLGSAAGPVGTAVGGIAGSVAGEKGSNWLYDQFFGSSAPQARRANDEQATNALKQQHLNTAQTQAATKATMHQTEALDKQTSITEDWNTIQSYLAESEQERNKDLQKSAEDLTDSTDLTKNKLDKLAEAIKKLTEQFDTMGVSVDKMANGGMGAVGGGTPNLAGATPAKIEQATKFFMSGSGGGYSREQAAGIVSNLIAESGLKTNALGDNGKAYGLAQWHPDRQALFRQVMRKDIKNSTYEEQLQFVAWELANSESKAGNILRGARSAGVAAGLFDRYYERSAGLSTRQRMVNAEEINKTTKVSAARGGVFTGPNTGYPATLHGDEIVAPLNLDSVLMKLAKTPAAQVDILDNPVASKTTKDVESPIERLTAYNVDALQALGRKMDTMINILETSYDAQHKILKHART